MLSTVEGLLSGLTGGDLLGGDLLGGLLGTVTGLLDGLLGGDVLGGGLGGVDLGNVGGLVEGILGGVLSTVEGVLGGLLGGDGLGGILDLHGVLGSLLGGGNTLEAALDTILSSLGDAVTSIDVSGLSHVGPLSVVTGLLGSVLNVVGLGANSLANIVGDTVGSADRLNGTANADHLNGYLGNDVIHGANGDDRIDGGTGADTLYGDAGNDTITGGLGNDVIVGGAGADIMIGGAGNDTYYVDNFGDRTQEQADGGIDWVVSTKSWTLADNVENLMLAAGSGSQGVGNAAANTIWGNETANGLAGLAGNDILDGKAGNDVLDGGAGTDTLTGGAGADSFRFQSIAHSVVGAGRDVITDFSHSQGDKIDLHYIDANTKVAGDQAFSFIGSANFTGVAGQLHFQGGILSGDINGDGHADFEIQVKGAATLVIGDFVL
ncbi:calcium-binding protein [Inquilinus limosus]|uniref:calcium-binding protein n=1 Tax=Inquilinus limosus TaxID=171674 RepID=UPI00068E38B6|nr:calcium-binding protein [Inquilinus limosus]